MPFNVAHINIYNTSCAQNLRTCKVPSEKYPDKIYTYICSILDEYYAFCTTFPEFQLFSLSIFHD